MKPKYLLLCMFVSIFLLSISSDTLLAAPPAHEPTPTPEKQEAPPIPPEIQVLPQETLAKIEPLVIEELTLANQTDFFIWMTEKADLESAYRLKTKEEKGRFVFETLRQTAERSQAALRQDLDNRKADYRPFYIANKILVRGGNATLLANVVARPDVARITANHQFQLEEPRVDRNPPAHVLAVEPNLSFVNADDVWALGYDGRGTVLAGNDTGLDWDHPALINQYRGWDGATADHNYNWWDATGTYPNVPGDGYGHGTHTTGTMVGDDGGTNQIGMAPGAQTIHCKNMTDVGSGSDATFTECFQWDLAPWDLSGANPRPDLAPNAINNSWGYWGGGASQFEDEIAALQAAGILVEVSAGNEGPGCRTLRSPSDYRQSLTTGSINHAGGSLPGTLTGFSSRGPSGLYPADYMPDVMAPGESIRSSLPGNTYTSWSGTSMAGPHTVGLVGLMWSANPGLRGMVTETVQIILDTAVPLTDQTGSNCGGDYSEGPNNDWGYGTIDALAAVQQAILYGGTGTLTGTLTDAVLQTPIPEAAIQATLSPTMTWRTASDPQGNYVMQVFSGTYTVDTSRYGYLPAQIANVSVVSGTTTTLDIALTPAPDHVVSGFITDSATGWPLYASINIDGYPGGPVWSDPVSGYYSVTLAEGLAYTFEVAAPNYTSQSRTVGPLSGDQTQDFALQVDFGQGCPGGYQETVLFFDGFESGSLDPGWSIATTNEGRVQVSPSYPYSGSYSVLLDDAMGGGPQSIAAIILTQDLSGQSHANLDFWWREFSDENDPQDGVFISDDYGANWHEVLSFNNGPSTFRNDVIDISAAAAANGLTLNDHFQIKFQFYDDYPITTDGYAIDEVQLSTCTLFTSGRVTGHVYDANTGLALDGAVVESDSGQTTTTDASGVYELFDTPGAHTMTSTTSGGYGPDVQTVTVIQDDTIQQDFNLPAGWLSYTPSSLEATLGMGESTTVLFNLTNSGGAAATFELQEKDKGFHILWTTTGPFADPKPLVPAEYQEAASAEGLELPAAPVGTALAAGDVIQSWPSGLTDAWGIAYDGDDDTVWVGLGWDTTNTIYEYQLDGTLTGRSYPYTWGPTYGPADSAFNWNTGMIWTLDVGGDNCLHEMDLVAGYTGNTICGPWSISQRGIAYDPATDTWYVGGWNEGTIYHIDSSGTLLDSALVSLPISGLAYNPDTQHLFVQVNSGTDDVYVLDASQAGMYPQIGQFHIGTLVSGAGLEMDCQGNLWAVDQSNERVYQAESGETASLCSQDVPWLSEDPDTGTIASLADQPVTITFDASVPEITQPGQYYAELKIKDDTPYSLLNVPVTMTVNSPVTWGKLKGTVTGLGYCDADPAPLENAELLIEGSTGVTWTLETDVNGAYQLWLDESHSPLIITATYPDYELGLVSDVSVTGQMTTTQDIDLRWLQPCVSIAPSALNVTVPMSRVVTQTLTISNMGASVSDFALAESDGGFAPAHLPSADPLHAGGQVHVITEDKESDSTPTDQPAFPLDTGGPDPFGYTYRDSSEPDGPTYQWIEIAPPAGGSGTEIPGLTGVDDGYFWPLSLPFTFNFYGTDYTELAVASNGTLYFEDDYLGFGNTSIPGYNSYDIDTFIAHLWDDLVVDPGAVYYQVLDSMLVIEYYQVRGFGTSGSGVWEIILFANGNLLFQYQDATIGGFRDYGGSATVGIQGDTATGLPYSYNTPALSDGLAICFAYPGQAPNCSLGVPWLSEDPTSGSVAAGGTQTSEVTFDASVPEVTQCGQYYASLIVQTDDPVTPWLQVPVTMSVTRYGLELTPSVEAKSGDPNTAVTYALQITNTGLNTDTFDIAVASNDWTTTAPAQVGPLVAGASANADVTVLIPASAAGGATDTATITVTSQGDDTQSATATLTTTANPIYAVRVAPSTQAQSGSAGATVTYTLQVTNIGNTTDAFTLTASGNGWPTGVPLTPGMSTVEVQLGPLAAGASDVVDIIVAIPPDAPTGATDTATITVTSQGDGTQWATATLTTTTGPLGPSHKLFLPFIVK